MRITSGSERRAEFSAYLHDLSRLSARKTEYCDIPITAADVQDAMAGCVGEKLPGLDGFPYELYCHMSN